MRKQRLSIVWACLSVATISVLGACSNSGNGQLYEFVTEGGSEGSGESQFRYIEDFAFDAAGNILVTDALNRNVQVFTNTGEFVAEVGGRGGEDGKFEKPEGIAVDGDGNQLVGDYLAG